MRGSRSVVRLVLLLSAIVALGAPQARARGEGPLRQDDNEVTRLIEKLSVMPPHHHGGLTLFSLELTGTEDETDYASLRPDI